jgi:hypothetical protein
MAISKFSFDPRRRAMRLASVGHRDPTDPHCWSGIPSHMLENLSQYADLQLIGPMNTIRHLYLGHKSFFVYARGVLTKSVRTLLSGFRADESTGRSERAANP